MNLDIINILREEINNIIEIRDDSELDSYQLRIKSLTPNDIYFDCVDNHCSVRLRDKELDNRLKELTKGFSSMRDYPMISFDEPKKWNRINITSIPDEFKNLGLGKKIYLCAANTYGFISTNNRERSDLAKRVWNSLASTTDAYHIKFNDVYDIEVLISKNKIIEILPKIFNNVKELHGEIPSYKTNIPNLDK